MPNTSSAVPPHMPHRRTRKAHSVSKSLQRPADPRRADPRRTDPRSAGPSSADPRSVDPRSADPRRADPRRADPGRADPGRSDPGRAVPKRTGGPQRTCPQRACPSACARLWDRLLQTAEHRSKTAAKAKANDKQSPQFEDFTFAPRSIGDDHLRRSFEHAVIHEGLQVTVDFNLPVDPSTHQKPKSAPSQHASQPNRQPVRQSARQSTRGRPPRAASRPHSLLNLLPDEADDDDADSMQISPALPRRKPVPLESRSARIPVSQLPPSDLALLEQKAAAPPPPHHIPIRERLRNDEEMAAAGAPISGSYRAVPSPSRSTPERRRLSKTTKSVVSPDSSPLAQTVARVRAKARKREARRQALSESSRYLDAKVGQFATDDDSDEHMPDMISGEAYAGKSHRPSHSDRKMSKRRNISRDQRRHSIVDMGADTIFVTDDDSDRDSFDEFLSERYGKPRKSSLENGISPDNESDKDFRDEFLSDRYGKSRKSSLRTRSVNKRRSASYAHKHLSTINRDGDTCNGPDVEEYVLDGSGSPPARARAKPKRHASQGISKPDVNFSDGERNETVQMNRRCKPGGLLWIPQVNNVIDLSNSADDNDDWFDTPPINELSKKETKSHSPVKRRSSEGTSHSNRHHRPKGKRVDDRKLEVNTVNSSRPDDGDGDFDSDVPLSALIRKRRLVAEAAFEKHRILENRSKLVTSEVPSGRCAPGAPAGKSTAVKPVLDDHGRLSGANRKVSPEVTEKSARNRDHLEEDLEDDGDSKIIKHAGKRRKSLSEKKRRSKGAKQSAQKPQTNGDESSSVYFMDSGFWGTSASPRSAHRVDAPSLSKQASAGNSLEIHTRGGSLRNPSGGRKPSRTPADVIIVLDDDDDDDDDDKKTPTPEEKISNLPPPPNMVSNPSGKDGVTKDADCTEVKVSPSQRKQECGEKENLNSSKVDRAIASRTKLSDESEVKVSSDTTHGRKHEDTLVHDIFDAIDIDNIEEGVMFSLNGEVIEAPQPDFLADVSSGLKRSPRLGGCDSGVPEVIAPALFPTASEKVGSVEAIGRRDVRVDDGSFSRGDKVVMPIDETTSPWNDVGETGLAAGLKADCDRDAEPNASSSGQDTVQECALTPDSSFGGLITPQTSSRLQEKLNCTPPAKDEVIKASVAVLRSKGKSREEIDFSSALALNAMRGDGSIRSDEQRSPPLHGDFGSVDKMLVESKAPPSENRIPSSQLQGGECGIRRSITLKLRLKPGPIKRKVASAAKSVCPPSGTSPRVDANANNADRLGLRSTRNRSRRASTALQESSKGALRPRTPRRGRGNTVSPRCSSNGEKRRSGATKMKSEPVILDRKRGMSATKVKAGILKRRRARLESAKEKTKLDTVGKVDSVPNSWEAQLVEAPGASSKVKSPAKKRPCLLNKHERAPAMSSWGKVLDVDATVDVPVTTRPEGNWKILSMERNHVSNDAGKCSKSVEANVKSPKKGGHGLIATSIPWSNGRDVPACKVDRASDLIGNGQTVANKNASGDDDEVVEVEGRRDKIRVVRKLDIPRKRGATTVIDNVATKRMRVCGASPKVAAVVRDGPAIQLAMEMMTWTCSKVDKSEDEKRVSTVTDEERGQPIRRRYGTPGSLRRQIAGVSQVHPNWEDGVVGGSSMSSSLHEAGANVYGTQQSTSSEDMLHPHFGGGTMESEAPNPDVAVALPNMWNENDGTGLAVESKDVMLTVVDNANSVSGGTGVNGSVGAVVGDAGVGVGGVAEVTSDNTEVVDKVNKRGVGLFPEGAESLKRGSIQLRLRIVPPRVSGN